MVGEIDLYGFTNDLEFSMNLIAWIVILLVLFLFTAYGIKFIRKGQSLREIRKDHSTFYRGIGIFMISVSFSQIIYIFDYAADQLFGGRIFGRPPFDFASMIDRDYMVLIFFVLLLSCAFLIYPLEHYMLGMKRKIMTNITCIAIPFPIVIRVIEYSLGVNLTSDSLYFLIFTAFWYGVIAIIAITVAILFFLYIQVARKVERGSLIMKKSIAIIFGFLLWLGAVFTTSIVLKELVPFGGNFYDYIYPFVIPIILLIVLQLILYGYRSS